jgi:hypothetical protein
MHRWGLSLGLGAALALLSLPGYGAFIPTGGEEMESEIAPRDVAYETQLHCVALAVYFEGGSTFETEEGQRHIARVVVERAKSDRTKWGGADPCDVVFYKRAGVCQFSFACLPLARRTPRAGALWERSLEIAQDELEGRSTVSEQTIRYYMNPALTSDRNACRFRKEFVPVVAAGRHAFFREPTEAERAELTKSDFAECRRYAAALEAKRIAAEKKRLAALAKKKRLAAIKKKTKKVHYAGK